MRPFRFVHIGLAAALAAASATTFGLSGHLSAAPGDPSSIVPTVPCRLLDTRATSTVGPRSTPIGPEEEVTVAVWGTNGNCTVPDTATGIVANVTTINGTADSFLAVFPADATLPLTSNQNWLAENPREPHPNQVTVALSATGEIKLFNGYGTVDVIVDIMSYLTAEGGGLDSSAGNWGVINRNTVGSPVAELRAGPFSPALTGDADSPFAVGDPVSGPPIGSGSLNFSVADGELATFGNEVDYFNTPFDITAVGFHVYQVPENLSGGNLAPMPNIAMEIDPNITGIAADYATLVYIPPTQLVPGWGGYIDATTTGVWGITGAAFTGQPCAIGGALCGWAELQTFLADGGDAPTLFTVAVKKGSDTRWHGAVDGLRVNDTVYDFEEHGVAAVPAT